MKYQIKAHIALRTKMRNYRAKLFKQCTLPLLLLATFQMGYAQNQLGELFNDKWSKITYLVDKQPVFDISKDTNIIISEVVNNVKREDNHSVDVYDEFVNQVVQIDGLKLIDRDKTRSLIGELNFQRSDYVDPSQIRKLGKFLGSGMIIFGRIQTDNFSQGIDRSRGLRSNGCTGQNRTATYRLDVNLKIINLETAEVLFSQTLKSRISKRSKTYYCNYPPDFNRVDLYQEANADIGKQFRELFTVHQKEYEIDFQTHRKFNKDLKHAINLLEIDDFEGGFAKVKEIAKKTNDPRARSFALYNVAKMQMFNGEYEISLKNAKEAYLLNPKNDACLEIINELK